MWSRESDEEKERCRQRDGKRWELREKKRPRRRGTGIETEIKGLKESLRETDKSKRR